MIFHFYLNNTKKLVCNLNDKNNYIVHINVLKQALDHGLKLRKVHRVIEFDQEAWLKEYIDVNTELRKKATNDFEKDFFKLMNNKKCLFDNGKVLKSQQRFKSENHEVYTENINKIALSCDDDKRIVTSDRITSYPYGYILKN